MIILFHFSFSMWTFHLTIIEPLQVLYISFIFCLSKIIHQVGKSGQEINCIISSWLVSGFWTNFIRALHTSVKLCGGIFVAIHTAIPIVPLHNNAGNLVDKNIGSFLLLS